MALTAPLAADWPVPKHLCSCLHHPLSSSMAPCIELLCPHRGTQAREGDAAGQDGEHHRDAYPNKHSIYEINASACLDECRETLMHPRRCFCFSKAGWYSFSVQTHLLHPSPASPARQRQPLPAPTDESYLLSVCWDCHRGRQTRGFGAGQHRVLHAPEPAGAELNQVAAGRDQMPGGS